MNKHRDRNDVCNQRNLRKSAREDSNDIEAEVLESDRRPVSSNEVTLFLLLALWVGN